MNFIVELLRMQKAFAGVGGKVISGSYRNFTATFSLLGLWLKKLVGNAGFGTVQYVSGIKASGAALDLTFSGSKRGIGLKLDVSVPRDEPLNAIEATFYPQGASGAYTVNLVLRPEQHNSQYYLLSAYSSSTEVYPIDSVDPQLSIADGKIPDGSAVTAYLLNLGEGEVLEASKMV